MMHGTVARTSGKGRQRRLVPLSSLQRPPSGAPACTAAAAAQPAFVVKQDCLSYPAGEMAVHLHGRHGWGTWRRARPPGGLCRPRLRRLPCLAGASNCDHM